MKIIKCKLKDLEYNDPIFDQARVAIPGFGDWWEHHWWQDCFIFRPGGITHGVLVYSMENRIMRIELLVASQGYLQRETPTAIKAKLISVFEHNALKQTKAALGYAEHVREDYLNYRKAIEHDTRGDMGLALQSF